jgi:hypothetical protein
MGHTLADEQLHERLQHQAKRLQQMILNVRAHAEFVSTSICKINDIYVN